MRGRVSRISSAVKTIAVYPAAGSVTMTTTAGTTQMRISVVGFQRPLLHLSAETPRVWMNISHTHIQRHASPYITAVAAGTERSVRLADKWQSATRNEPKNLIVVILIYLFMSTF